MGKFENAIELLTNNGIAYSVKYNVGFTYEIDIIFDELGYTPAVKKVYDYITGELIG